MKNTIKKLLKIRNGFRKYSVILDSKKSSNAVQKSELRPGIGLCDECLEPKWPQKHVGYGMMICADCLDKNNKEE